MNIYVGQVLIITWKEAGTIFHFADKKIEVLKGEVTWPKLHG